MLLLAVLTPVVFIPSLLVCFLKVFIAVIPLPAVLPAISAAIPAILASLTSAAGRTDDFLILWLGGMKGWLTPTILGFLFLRKARDDLTNRNIKIQDDCLTLEFSLLFNIDLQE